LEILYTLVLVTLLPGSPARDIALRFQEHMPRHACERDARWFNRVHIPQQQKEYADDWGGALCVAEMPAHIPPN
jgi:hypothetical protein